MAIFSPAATSSAEELVEVILANYDNLSKSNTILEQPEPAHVRHVNVYNNTGTLDQTVYIERLLG